MAIIVLLVFWGLVIKAWIMDGPKVPLVFIAIWLAAFFGLPLLGLGGYYFLGVEALLAMSLIVVDRYNQIV